MLSLAALISLASPECLDGNCNSTEADQSVPVLHINIGALFPIFGPVDMNDDRNHFGDDAIDPRLPIKNENDTSEDSSSADSSERVMSVNVFEMIISGRNDGDVSEDQQLDDNFASLMFGNNQPMIEDFETLDLSGQTLTGEYF